MDMKVTACQQQSLYIIMLYIPECMLIFLSLHIVLVVSLSSVIGAFCSCLHLLTLLHFLPSLYLFKPFLQPSLFFFLNSFSLSFFILGFTLFFKSFLFLHFFSCNIAKHFALVNNLVFDKDFLCDLGDSWCMFN